MKNIDYFDYKTLANPRFITPKHFSSVCHYGNYKAIAKLKNSRFNFITEYLEHGISFYCRPEDVALEGYANRLCLKRIYTFGNVRKSTLDAFYNMHNLRRKVIAIGPYIKGAEFFKTQKELDLLKQKYGKILLVFPSHSIKTIHAKYDEADLMKEIFRIENDFDMIFICLYWKDILDKQRLLSYEKYISDKIKIVSAGHSSDPNFLSRLKDLIWLSDVTMSNNIGTHLGYSICMGKAHYLFNQTVEYIVNGSSKINAKVYPDTPKFYDLFGNYPANITSEQKELIERYWGKW
ncbi:MAG: hypothetical protein LBG15_03275 [Dysgonamonadaceae bacterium]|jgi:hypothetical protein|nr:hypothetical protein [Dysgonamonadaceae bacterium]